jgi:hypothetical protein
MTRLVLSLICGVAIPFIYSVVVGPLTNYTDNFTLRRLGYIPIGWPRLLLEKISSSQFIPFQRSRRDRIPCFHYWVEHIFVWVSFVRSHLDYFTSVGSIASQTPTASTASILVARQQAYLFDKTVSFATIPNYKASFRLLSRVDTPLPTAIMTLLRTAL